jgi:hypothetical protein
VKSKPIRVEALRLARIVVSQHPFNEMFEGLRMGGCRADPPLIFFQLIDKELRKPILLPLRHRPQTLNCLFHESGHATIIPCSWHFLSFIV